jgi:ribosomal RNA-processing protein 12
VLPGPAAAARAAAAASNKQRSAAEQAITCAVADALHLLGALKQLLPLMAGPCLPGVMDQVLKLYSLRQPLLTRHATDALAALAAAPGGHLSPGHLDQLMGLALDGEELWAAASAGGSAGADGPLALVRLVEVGLRSLAERDPAAAARRLPRAAHALVAQLGARQDGVRHGAREVLAGLLSDAAVVSDSMVADGARAAARGGGPPSPLAGVIAALVLALRPAAAESWGLAISAATSLLRRLGEAMQAALTGQLATCAGGSAKRRGGAGGSSEEAQQSDAAASQVIAQGIALVAAPLVRQLGELCGGAFDAEEDAAGGDPLVALTGGADADDDSDGEEPPGGGGGRRGSGGRRVRSKAAAGQGVGSDVAEDHGPAAEAALGVALRWLGPEVVLATLPLQLKEGVEGAAEPRTWLLPMLRRHVRGARLSYWGAALLPLARALGTRAAGATAAGDKLLALHCHTLEAQIWAALPAFCSWPADGAEAYPTAAKDWAAAFHAREDLRSPVAAALERLCRQARAAAIASGDESLLPPGERRHGPGKQQQAVHQRGKEEPDERGALDSGGEEPLDSEHEYGAPSRGRGGGSSGRGRSHLDGGAEAEAGVDPELGSPPAWFDGPRATAQLGALRLLARNWLPLLLTTFLESEPDGRGPIAAAISAYASIADAALVGSLFRSALSKLVKIQRDAAAEVGHAPGLGRALRWLWQPSWPLSCAQDDAESACCVAVRLHPLPSGCNSG